MTRVPSWAKAVALPTLFLLIRELALEVIFSPAGDWLRNNGGLIGDFLSWRWSTLIITLLLLGVSALLIAYWDLVSTALFRGEQAKGPRTQGGLQPAGMLELRKIPGPNSADVALLQFQTQNQEIRELDLGGTPEALRFIEPVNRIIHSEKELPIEFPCGKGTVTVKRFTKNGFSIEERGTYGDWVRVEHYRTSQTLTPDPVVIETKVPEPTVIQHPPTLRSA